MERACSVYARANSGRCVMRKLSIGLVAAAAVALGGCALPLAAVLPFIELGLGKDSPCGELIAKARRKEG